MEFNNDTNNATADASDLIITDAQLWDSLLEDHVQVIRHEEQSQQKSKKKCHGNRKLRRYRRKMRKRAMNTDARSQLTNPSVDNESETNNTIPPQNTETTSSSIHESVVHQTTVTKKRNMNNRYSLSLETKNNLKRLTNFIDIDTISIIQSSKNLMATIDTSFDYMNTSDEAFHRMLLQAFINDTEKLNHFLNENEQIPFIRRYTSLMGRVSYIKLQQLQWDWYYDIGMTRNIWTGRIQKDVAAKNSICYTYSRSKTCIEKRLKTIQKQLQEAQNALESFEHEILSKSSYDIDCCSEIRSLSSIVYTFIDEKQQKLRDLFEYEKQMLIFDANDHYLVQDFYRLKPSISQVNEKTCTFLTILCFLHLH